MGQKEPENFDFYNLKTPTTVPVFLDDPVKEDLESDHGHEAETHHETDTNNHPQLQGSPNCLLT